MFSLGMLGGLNTPETLAGDVEGQKGPQESRLSLSRTGLTQVADCVFKNSALKVSLDVFELRIVLFINAHMCIKFYFWLVDGSVPCSSPGCVLFSVLVS